MSGFGELKLPIGAGNLPAVDRATPNEFCLKLALMGYSPEQEGQERLLGQ